MHTQPPAKPGRVDIRLLGPLELSVGQARPVPVASTRQRTLLGLLALRAPAVVSVAHLIDGVWPDDPPPAAVKTLRVHVAHLRRALEEAGAAGLIVTRPPGYALDVAAECVDAYWFDELSRQGRAALAAGRADEAAEHLRAAVQLWRGDVLADCPIGEGLSAEAARLTEARLSTIEDLYAAEIARGQHAWAAAELESMVAQHPLRERLWELLMTAQHRGGRQGEALGTYQRARQVLIAELAVEPGAALRRLEGAILRGDEELDAGAAPAAPPTAAIPVPITRLIGRRQEIAEVGHLLDDRRLVTLVGMGGCGKTRLAIAVAERRGEPVRFVDLAATGDPDVLPTAVATALDLQSHAGVDPTDLLVRSLRPRRLLLILDNCEHLVDACGPLVGRLLGACPELRVLATSREALGVLGEVTWPVPPLAAPPPESTGGLAEVSGYDAVRLFLDRAALDAVRHLGDEDAAGLRAICAGLDGLPLAIELAAARTNVLTVLQIAARLHDPALLHGRGAGARAHHNALRQTMAWSYGLLSAAAQSRFRRLSVFAGGFTIDAVARVWAELAGDVVDALDGLVSKSLLVTERQPAGARYRLLETLRQYAAERLAAAPEELAEARRRHAGHYRAMAEDIDRNLSGPDLDRLLDQLAAEHDNLRVALEWYAEHGSGPDELRFATALARYCHLRGRYGEGRQWLAGALSRSREPASPALGRALLALARLAFFECDYAAALVHGERAIVIYREIADRPGTAQSSRLLASIARERGHYQRALTRYREAEAAYRSAGDDPGVATTLQMAGFTSWLMSDLDTAERLLDNALGGYQLLGDPEGIASARVHLAAVAFYRGDAVRAEWLAADALARFQKLDFDEGVAWALNILGLVEHHAGAYRGAAELLRRSLTIHCRLGDRWRAASVLEALAAVLVNAPEGAALAAELIGAASAIRAAIGTPVPPSERPAWDSTAAALRGALDDRDRLDAHARGEALRLADAPARLARVWTIVAAALDAPSHTIAHSPA